MRRRLFPILFSNGASAFSPTDISGLSLWYDFSAVTGLYQTNATTTPVTADGQTIGYATDKSGSGIHGTQATEGNRPLWKANIQNSLGAALFDATDDFLGYAYPLGAATDFTIFVVFNYINPANYNMLVGSPLPGTYFIQTGGTNAIYAGTANGATRIATAGAFVADNTFYIFTLTKSGTGTGNLTLLKNGGTAQTNTGQTAPNPISSALRVGYVDATNNFLNGYICEYIVYQSALAAANRQAVETYLNTKWAVY